MTRDRIYGSDAPFMAWCRSCDELPSYSRECGWVQTDVDTFLHRYISSVDGVGTREVQCMMELEVKTRGGELTTSQADTYRKKHAMTIPSLKFYGQSLVNYGISILRLDGASPTDSKLFNWGRFQRSSDTEIFWRQITAEQFIHLLRFEIHPDTLKEISFRRHHKTSTFVLRERTELGFSVDRNFINRS